MVQAAAGEFALLAAWLAVDRDVHCLHLTFCIWWWAAWATLLVVPVGGVLVLGPAGNDAVAEHLVQQPGQVVLGIEREGGVHVVRRCHSLALPPADVTEHRQRCCRMCRGCDGEQLA